MILKTASQFTKDYLCLDCSTNCRPYIQLRSKVSHPLNNNCRNTWVWRLSSWIVEGQGKKYRPKFFFRKQQQHVWIPHYFHTNAYNYCPLLLLLRNCQSRCIFLKFSLYVANMAIASGGGVRWTQNVQHLYW